MEKQDEERKMKIDQQPMKARNNIIFRSISSRIVALAVPFSKRHPSLTYWQLHR